MLVGNSTRRVAIVGGARIPFVRSMGAYAECSNQQMLTAALQALADKYRLAGERLGDVGADIVTDETEGSKSQAVDKAQKVVDMAFSRGVTGFKDSNTTHRMMYPGSPADGDFRGWQSKLEFRELGEVVRSVDASLVVVQPEFVEAKIARQLAQRRFYLVVLVLFGGLGLVLTVVGIWGVVAHLTRQRTRESAIRVALGARPGQVTALVVRQGLVPVCLLYTSPSPRD